MLKELGFHKTAALPSPETIARMSDELRAKKLYNAMITAVKKKQSPKIEAMRDAAFKAYDRRGYPERFSTFIDRRFSPRGELTRGRRFEDALYINKIRK